MIHCMCLMVTEKLASPDGQQVEWTLGWRPPPKKKMKATSLDSDRQDRCATQDGIDVALLHVWWDYFRELNRQPKELHWTKR